MVFKDLKAGYPIHLLDRITMKYEQAKVMNVGLPHNDPTPGQYGKMLIDVTIQTKDGKQNAYSLSDSEQTAYAGNLMISVSKEYVLNEVRSTKVQAEEYIKSVESKKTIITACDKLLGEIDTDFKEKQENEERFKKIDERFEGLEGTLGKILAAVNKNNSKF